MPPDHMFLEGRIVISHGAYFPSLVSALFPILLILSIHIILPFLLTHVIPMETKEVGLTRLSPLPC